MVKKSNCTLGNISLIFLSSVCVWLRVTAIQTHLVRSGHVAEDSGLYSLWTRYNGESKTDLWDDSEVRTGSCSEDQMTTRFQNRVISFECLHLYHFLIYCCQFIYIYVTYFISFDRLIYLTRMITRTILYDISDRTPYLFS